MKGKSHEGENGLATHGNTRPGNEPVKDRLQSPSKAYMIVEDPILFPAESKKKSNPNNQSSQKDGECDPESRSGQKCVYNIHIRSIL
jgi:hypothetical protein